jgi:ATP-dependent Clp protease ATP-binding subunit ClpX
MPQDFVKFGLIPEFVGRVPVCVALDLLDEEALVRILTEPKNAIVKQYKKLFELDGVELDFEEEAIRVIAKRSLERKTGARGLRAIMESVMMDSMYKVPSDTKILRCIITKEAAEGNTQPTLISAENNEPRKTITKRTSKKNSNEIA